MFLIKKNRIGYLFIVHVITFPYLQSSNIVFALSVSNFDFPKCFYSFTGMHLKSTLTKVEFFHGSNGLTM